MSTTDEPTNQSPETASTDNLPDPDLKIILLGDSAVGKSKIIERFLLDDYVPRQMSTFALTVYRHSCPSPIKPDGPSLHIDFWDTAGQERFNSMHPSYYYRAHACLLVFDAQRKITYQHLEHWYDELQQQRPGLPVIVVANKVDTAEEVVNKAFAFTKKRKECVGPVRFVSAADGRNVVRVMKELIGVADEYRRKGNESDFTGEVMDVLDYFDRKDKKDKVAATGKPLEEEKTA